MNMYNILIIDSYSQNRETYSTIFSDSIFVPSFTGGKKNIISILNTQVFDAVIIDYDCYDIDVCVIAEQIRNIKPGLPVLFVSSNAELIKNDSHLLSLSDDILTKPLVADNLIKRIKWHLKISKRTNSINQLFFNEFINSKTEVDVSLW
jgi:DNA-binding response OmpR family regulator